MTSRFRGWRRLPDTCHCWRSALLGCRPTRRQIDDRHTRKHILVLCQKAEGRIPHGHDDIYTPAGVPLLMQVIAHQPLVRLGGEAIALQRLGVKLHAAVPSCRESRSSAASNDGRNSASRPVQCNTRMRVGTSAPRARAEGRDSTRTPRSPRWHDERGPGACHRRIRICVPRTGKAPALLKLDALGRRDLRVGQIQFVERIDDGRGNDPPREPFLVRRHTHHGACGVEVSRIVSSYASI